uniref:Uncharacterized protein n=1 Tax=Acrobeloides nanus TaxID=290746 RepID=A0A914CBS0_9BILA
MCIAFVLMLNAFYKIYYGLFDLCEQLIALVSLLCVLCFFSLLFFFDFGRQGSYNSLVTISILGIGVFGGLLVVIVVVHVYRLLLKRRLPITTTNRPHQKRAHIRNLQPSRWQPLTVPSLKRYETKETFPINKHVSFRWEESFSDNDRMLSPASDEFAYIDEENDDQSYYGAINHVPMPFIKHPNSMRFT